MQRFLGKKILLGVSGGIAAYKSIELARFLQQEGAIVQVVMTQSAQDFIGAQSFQAVTAQPVWCETNDKNFERSMAHIDLSRWADMMVIAPATANVMAKLAYGLTDDLLSLLAMMMSRTLVLCPAMNVNMWQHPATQANYNVLLQRGVIFLGPDAGSQACGDQGLGRMREPEYVLNNLEWLPIYRTLVGRTFVMTAGPTQEPIDPIRFVSNRSSGLMGYHLAEALAFAGAQVILISGPTHLANPPGVERYMVETSQEMYETVFAHLNQQDGFIGVAAVSDFQIQEPKLQKIKKTQNTDLELKLISTIDILHQVKQANLVKKVIGFAAETEHVTEYAQAKLKAKADMIIANQVGKGLVFGQRHAALQVMTAERVWQLPFESKMRLSLQLVEIFKDFFED
jgi:phosphopantothenoylcysteine decarboxylase/phosphopantothenate--cysteine ligase